MYRTSVCITRVEKVEKSRLLTEEYVAWISRIGLTLGKPSNQIEKVCRYSTVGSGHNDSI